MVIHSGFHLIRTDAQHSDFISLVRQLDAYLTIVDGDQHGFYDQYNKISNIRYCIIGYFNQVPIACGAIKEYGTGIMEIKRMYTNDAYRGKGYATMILVALEIWAKELGYTSCILETGLGQVEAVAFYHKNQYQVIPNFGQYAGVENSICFEKKL